MIIGVIEYHKKIMLQSNPNAAEGSGRGRRPGCAQEFAPRRAEVQTEIARGYASRFTEAGTQGNLAFYKTPLGKKLIVEEPDGVDEATKRVDALGRKFAEEVLVRIRAEMKKKGHNL